VTIWLVSQWKRSWDITFYIEHLLLFSAAWVVYISHSGICKKSFSLNGSIRLCNCIHSGMSTFDDKIITNPSWRQAPTNTAVLASFSNNEKKSIIHPNWLNLIWLLTHIYLFLYWEIMRSCHVTPTTQDSWPQCYYFIPFIYSLTKYIVSPIFPLSGKYIYWAG
jgi:hypothetical protein